MLLNAWPTAQYQTVRCAILFLLASHALPVICSAAIIPNAPSIAPFRFAQPAIQLPPVHPAILASFSTKMPLNASIIAS